MRRFWRRLGVAVLLLLLAAVAIGLWGVREFTLPGPLTAARTVIVSRGAGDDVIAMQLTDAGVIAQPQLFEVGAKLLSQGGRLKPGEYAFAASVSPRDIIDAMVNGRTIKRRITV